MQNLRHIVPYLAKHRFRIIVGVIAILAGTGTSVIQPYILRLAVDSLNTKHHTLTVSKLTTYVLIYLAAAAGQSVFAFLQRTTVNRVSRYLEYEMRNDAFRHLQALDQPFYLEMHTGDLLARL